jgi:hypothetical protein
VATVHARYREDAQPDSDDEAVDGAVFQRIPTLADARHTPRVETALRSVDQHHDGIRVQAEKLPACFHSCVIEHEYGRERGAIEPLPRRLRLLRVQCARDQYALNDLNSWDTFLPEYRRATDSRSPEGDSRIAALAAINAEPVA